MTSPQKIAAAREDLEDRTDGPVTAFVLMARACDLSADGRHDPEALANALHDSLQYLSEPLTSLERC